MQDLNGGKKLDNINWKEILQHRLQYCKRNGIAMPRVKATAGRLIDPERFYTYKAEEKYKEIIEPQKILEEKGFQFPK